MRPRQAVQVCLKRTGTPSAPIHGPSDFCAYMKKFGDADRESLHVLHLDARHRVIGHEEAHKGTLTGVDVHPREVFKGAILNNAAAVVISHNHPSGDATASVQDIGLTQRLAEVGKMVGIPLLDHVIVAGGVCTAFSERHPYALQGSETQAPADQPRRRRKSSSSASDDVACPPGCQSTKRKDTVWWAFGLIAVPLGALALWKWRQISLSGVPIDFGLRRTFSRDFAEGYLGLQRAWHQSGG